MKKIAFIPIDNRPVCYQLPKQIVALDKNNEFYFPEIEFPGFDEKEFDKALEVFDKRNRRFGGQ